MRAKILNASAGSGKTYQLAYKYVHDVVEQPSLYRHILAVTFTNKATEEMKSRILKEIHLLASGGESAYLGELCRELKLDAATVRRRAAEARAKILHDYSRFTVLTIDTFFQRILRAFIKELGIDLDYNIEIETSSVLSRSTDTLIEAIAADKELLRWMTGFVEERIAEGSRWDVRQSILALGGELFKEKNRPALSVARSKEELRRIVHDATA
ncbi:MAG: UvrD-helicase domain-containing protein, partial [Alistipes sp.]|nr:UvrD-helicase domain-containing protein [Alistipes sp.]